jgi:hypothetical protein
MPVIDLSTSIDDSKLFGLKEIPANPIFEDMEESEIEIESEEQVETEAEPDFNVKFRSDREKDYYSTLNEEEKEAWSGGWRGKMFKGLNKDGTPKPYKTAQEFLAFQKEHTPVLNERNRKLAFEKTALEKQMAEMQKQMNVMLSVQKLAYEEKTQNKFESLEEAEEQAILEGDLAKVRAIQKQRFEFEKNKISFEEPEQKKQPQFQPEEIKVFEEWSSENAWYYQDDMLKNYAGTYFDSLSDRIPISERLETVSQEVKNRFSDKLGISKAPKVESGVRGIQSARKQNSYSELPEQIRKNNEFFAKRHNFNKGQIAKMQQTSIIEYFK